MTLSFLRRALAIASSLNDTAVVRMSPHNRTRTALLWNYRKWWPIKLLWNTGSLYTGWPKKLQIFTCLMLNWYSFVKSQPNFIIFGWEEDIILNIACKLISTIWCNWHYLVVCQHNSWANFILRQHRKRTTLFLQNSVRAIGAVDSMHFC